MSSLKSDRRKRFKKVATKQKWQLRTEEKSEVEESEAKESEATEQKSLLPTEEASDFAKPMSVVFTFDKLLKFLEMLCNNI